jgi:hypothetical protein
MIYSYYISHRLTSKCSLLLNASDSGGKKGKIERERKKEKKETEAGVDEARVFTASLLSFHNSCQQSR